MIPSPALNSEHTSGSQFAPAEAMRGQGRETVVQKTPQGLAAKSREKDASRSDFVSRTGLARSDNPWDVIRESRGGVVWLATYGLG